MYTVPESGVLYFLLARLLSCIWYFHVCFSMYAVPESGVLYFLLARSTHIANAYKEGRDIVVRLYSPT